MDKIFVDASEAARIIFSDGSPSVAALTLQEAVIGYWNLDPDKRAVAVIEMKGGRKFGAEEIGKLHYKDESGR